MPSQIDQQVKKDLKVAFNANTAINDLNDDAINAIDDGIKATNDVVDELAEVDVDENIVNVEDYMESHKEF